MGIPLQVLIVEDSADDALLLLHELRRGGYAPAHQRVDTPEALDAAFARERFDLVLVDHTMPQFNGLAALTMVKEKDPDVPFIFVSGTIGEDSAVAAMRAGAHDYIMKSNTKRLLPAIDRELREAGERRARRRAEDELRLMQNVMLAVSDAADVDAALSAALRLICESTDCESGQAWLLSSAADHLACSPAWYGCGPSADALRGASTRLRLGPGMGLPGRVWSTLQPICSTDLTREELGVRAEALADTSFKAAVAVPISAGADLVAVLELFRSKPLGDQQRLITSLSAIAAQLGGVIQRKRDEERMRYLANFDALTGLSNRILFYDRLRQALIDAHRHDRLVGVAFIDLDRFKAVNDSLGHEAGDVLLKSVAERLIGCVRQGDTVARISGDEFALILADMHQADDAARLAHKIVEGFAEPFHLKSKELFIGCSLGLAMFPADEASPEGLVRYADVAMYRAKQSGGNAYQFYRPEMTCRATERLEMENGLRHAIERQELVLHYQVKADAHTGAIAGVEALLRWQRKPNEILAPQDFLQIAEETGLIGPIGEWVLEQACRQVRLWKDAGMPQIRVAVNLSQRQLRQPDLARTIMRTLAEANLEARWLELEVTESMLAQATPESLALLHELSSLGTRIVLDDFGTGYSSLSHLARLPVDALKIDRSFIHGIPGEPNDCTIAASVIALAHSLKLSVVAEGVETQEQLHFLQARRCDEVQGLLIGKPAKADEILKAFGYGRWAGPQLDWSEPRRQTPQAASHRALDTWGTI